MYRAIVAVILAIGMVSLSPSKSHGEYIITLNSASDLSQLHVGDTFTLNLSLSGISGPTSYLDALGVTVQSSADNFNIPLLTLGSIVPDPSSALTSTAHGYSDATYDSLLSPTGEQITSNGIFFSSTFQATSVGTGTFNVTSATGFVGFDPVSIGTLPDGGLSYNVRSQAGGTTAVPVPPSMYLFVVGLASFGAARACGKVGPRSHIPASR
jgi:hypothetical protein